MSRIATIEGYVERNICMKTEDDMIHFQQALNLDTYHGEDMCIAFTKDQTVRVFATGIELEFPLTKVRFINENLE